MSLFRKLTEVEIQNTAFVTNNNVPSGAAKVIAELKDALAPFNAGDVLAVDIDGTVRAMKRRVTTATKDRGLRAVYAPVTTNELVFKLAQPRKHRTTK